MEVARETAKELVDEKDDSTLTKAETRGLKSLQKRIKEGDIVVMETDKSGRFSVISLEEYLEADDIHVRDDIEITEKELGDIERRLNAASSLFIKIFKIGQDSDHVSRHRANFITHSRNPSSMKLLHKDHKCGEEVKTRRLNGPGLNTPFSNLISEVLEPIAGNMKNKVERGSTENVLNDGDVYNEKVESAGVAKFCAGLVEEVVSSVEANVPEVGCEGNSDCPTTIGGKPEETYDVTREVPEEVEVFQEEDGSEVIVGLDANALYPSISKFVAMESCRKAALTTDIEIRSMNYLEATRFLALCVEKEQVAAAGLRGLLPRRRPGKDGKKTRKLKLTTANSLAPEVNNQEQWSWPKVCLTKSDKKKIFSMVVACMVQIFCETQVYSWRGKLYKQVKGLPIGPRATSGIARIVMNESDEMVGKELERLMIEYDIHIRYMDDIRMLLYNSLITGIRFTTETWQQNFRDHWGLPTLDTQWKVGKNLEGGKSKAAYLFYNKNVSTNFVTPFRSAQPLNGKVALKLQQRSRTFRCHELLGD